MAIGETMTNYGEWMQLYQDNLTSNQSEAPPSAAAEATEATYASATSTSRNNNLILDQGRISKPMRRRSRAARQTPTTLLNTDITNFRAMVQHFTGGAATRPQLPGGGAVSFSQQVPGGGSGVPGSGFYVQYHPNQFQPQHAFLSSANSRRGGSVGGVGATSNDPPPLGPSSVNDDGNHDGYML